MNKKLSRDEAEEYTRNIGQVAVGNFGLMEFAKNVLHVPEALGLSFDEWVQERLGGFVRMSVEQRRKAVANLSGEKSEGGYYAKTATEVAELLGISETTVKDDRRVIEVEGRPRPSTPAIEAGEGRPRPSTSEERRDEVERLAAYGKSAAEIAVELDLAVSTVQKDLTAIRRRGQQDRQPSSALRQARQEKAASAPATADQKGNEATFTEATDQITRDVAKAMGLSPDAYIISAIETMEQVEEVGHEVQNFEQCIAHYVQLGHLLWGHGAMRGFDVSQISEALRRFEEGR